MPGRLNHSPFKVGHGWGFGNAVRLGWTLWEQTTHGLQIMANGPAEGGSFFMLIDVSLMFH
jgi:hypothetical protein